MKSIVNAECWGLVNAPQYSVAKSENRQSVKGEALCVPKKKKTVKKKNQEGRWCPPLFPSLHQHFPIALRRTDVAARRRTNWLSRWPVWDGNPVLSRTRKSLAQRACRLNGHQCEVVVLVEGCILLRAATAPASLVALRWEGANVSRQMASHMRSLVSLPFLNPGYQCHQC